MTAAIVATTAPFGPDRTVIEAQVKLALDKLRRERGAYLASLDFYNGELDTDEGLQALSTQLLSNCPAILIATGQSVYKRKATSGRVYEVTLQIELLFASSSMRSPEARLHGDINSGADLAIGDDEAESYPTYDPGVYRMMRDVRDILLGDDFRLEGFGTIDASREDVVLTVPELTLWRCVYTVEYRWQKKRRTSRAPSAVREVQIDHNLSGSDDADIGNPVIRQERTP